MFNATILKKTEITPDLFIMAVKPDDGVPNFLPGQFVALGLPGSAPRPENFPPERAATTPDKIIKRVYSIGSSPLQRDALEFYIAVVPDGALTSRLVLPKEGERVFVAAKVTGTFTLEQVPDDQTLVFVATGTGLAPFISMIRTPQTWKPGRTVTLLHGVRYAADLAYRQELSDFKPDNGRFIYHPVVSRDPEFPGFHGHVQKLFEEGVVTLNPERDHLFLCGNPGMVESMEKFAVERGYKEHSKKSPGNLHVEKYW